MLRAHVALLAGACVLLMPGRSAAQSRWENQVGDQLSTAARVFSEKGFESTHDRYTGTLRQGEYEYLNVTLHAGTAYALVGVCDNDCHDLDLVLYDADGNEVDADRKTDDTPIVVASPGETERYRLKVIMVNCATSPCFYGIGTYGK